LDVFGLQDTRLCNKRECFTVMAIQSKSDLYHVSIPAADLQGIAAPTLVRAIADNASQMRPSTAPAVLGRQLQVVHLHHTANPLLVVSGIKVVIDQPCHASVAIGRAFSDHLLDLLQNNFIFLAAVKAGARLGFTIGAAATGA
jgi:hypothetical protein